jgi:hypothetical protein
VILESFLQCPFCLKIFEDPRILPCYDVACYKCIIEKLDDQNSYQCVCCDSTHTMDKDTDYPISQKVMKDLKRQKNKISCELLEAGFVKEFDKMKVKITELDEKELNFKNHLDKYCDFLRDDIVTRTESAINELNEHCEQLCGQVYDYQHNFINQWEKEENVYRKNLKTLIHDKSLVQNEMENLSTNQQLASSQIELALDKIKTSTNQLDNQSIELSKRIFSLKFIDSYHKIHSHSLGYLFNVKKCQKIILTNNTLERMFDASFANKHGNELFVFFYVNEYYNKYNSVIECYNVKRQPFNLTDSCMCYEKIDCFYFIDKLFIRVSPFNIDVSERSVLSVVNYSVKTKSFKYFSVCANKTTIYVLDYSFEVFCYSLTLKFLSSFGQTRHIKQPFYLKEVYQMDIRGNKFFLRRSDSIDIMDTRDGFITHSIEIQSYKFIINDKDKEIIAFCNDAILRYHLSDYIFISKIETVHRISNKLRFIDYNGYTDEYILLSTDSKDLYGVNF